MSIKQSISIVVSAVIGGVVGASIVLSEVRAQDFSEWVKNAKTLTANSINLTDGTGRVRCRLTAEGGNPICFFYGSGGGTMMRIGLLGPEDNNTPFISMNDKDRHERLGIGLSEAADVGLISYLRMRDELGHDGLIARSNSIEGATLDLSKGETGIYANSRENETSILFSNSNGKARMELGLDKRGKPVFWRNSAGMKPVDSKQITKTFKRLKSENEQIIKKTKEIQIWSDDENAKP